MNYLSAKNLLKDNFVGLILVGVLFLVTLFYTNIPTFNSNEGKMYVFLALVFITIPFLFERLRNSKIDRYVGELSFPIYLSHMLILKFTSLDFFPKIESVGFTTLILSVVFSLIIHNFLVKPIETWRQARV
jgi:peptidoglycan/LPS O-acetylase OafA/YrhL